MKILVCISHVPDTTSKINFKENENQEIADNHFKLIYWGMDNGDIFVTIEGEVQDREINNLSVTVSTKNIIEFREHELMLLCESLDV